MSETAARVVTATEAHIAELAADARACDVDELWASHRATPAECMRIGLRYSDEVLTGIVNGTPVCMFGVTPRTLLAGGGIPWMVAANSIRGHSITFLRRCRPVVKLWAAAYGRLENYVDARNTTAIRWLRWIGFTVYDAVPMGPDARPFHRFDMMGEGACAGR